MTEREPVARSVVTEAPEILVLPDPDAVADAAAERLVGALDAAIARRGRADIATTGGSAASGIYERLSRPSARDRVDWGRVHVWWGDDRYVPHDHPLSNVQPFESILLRIGARSWQSGDGGEGADVFAGVDAGVPLPAENVHPFPIAEAIGEGRGATWAAERYGQQLRKALPASADGWPAFDAILLGIGTDGHVLSVFPGSEAFDAREVALAIPAPTHIEPHVQRVTLNPAVLDHTPRLLPVAFGAAKADILAMILGPERDERRWPAQRALRRGATWILDEAAAARIAS